MLDAERTPACPRRNLRRLTLPFKLEGDVAAVTFAIDEHMDRRLRGDHGTGEARAAGDRVGRPVGRNSPTLSAATKPQ